MPQPPDPDDLVVLLRAVNVAGRSVPMAALRERLAEAGLGGVESYIQSGNLRVPARSVPRSSGGEPPAVAAEALAAAVEAVVRDAFGVPTVALVRTPAELAQVRAVGETLADPFGGGSRRYVAFLRDPLPADGAAEIAQWSQPGERAHLARREVYLWFTGPFHKARLSNARIERAGAVATTRDWKVVSALAQRWSVA